MFYITAGRRWGGGGGVGGCLGRRSNNFVRNKIRNNIGDGIIKNRNLLIKISVSGR